MRRNITGLKRSARLRSERTKERTLAALHRMDAADREINFRTVASEANVSTSWLYGQEELRARIMHSRGRSDHGQAPTAPAALSRERVSQQNIVATLRLRIKDLEERNRELTALLEVAYGKLALVPDASKAARRLHVNGVRNH